jgi:cytoskeletal protein CcmA (bactofilin family)
LTPSTRETSASISVIARTATVAGVLSGDRPLRVEGTVRGSIELAAPLEIAAGARVEAVVRAPIIRVAGTVVGDLEAAQRVELAPGAEIRGDIVAPSVHVAGGARLDGRVVLRVGVAGPATPPQT